MKTESKEKTVKRQKKVETVKKTAPAAKTDDLQKKETEKKEEKKEMQEKLSTPLVSGLFSKENKERFAKLVPSKPQEKEESKPQPQPKNRHQDDDLTIYVGNLPATIIQKPQVLRKAFSKFGTIKNLRFRSVAVQSSKLSHFDKKLMKKVSVIHNNLNEETKCVNAYIVFEDKQSVEKALALNDTVILDRHIVVDTVGKKDDKDMNARSVFVGNLSFDMDEEELRKFFEEGMKTMRSTTSKENKEEMVERVRIIREKDTRKGKGFGYVILKSPIFVPLALVLNGKKIGDREIRVKKCLGSVEAIQKQKLMDAAMNGRKKGKKQMKGPSKKIVVNEVEKKKEGTEKKEKKEKKEKEGKAKKVDLSFMGNRTKLSMNAINANKRLMKKTKK